jgi:thioredoxin:protein disulfide reductase
LTMGLWASLLIFSGIYSGALTYATTNREKFNQGVGLILLAYGFLILIGASMGAANPLQPLTELKKNTATAVKSPRPQTLNSLNQAIANARGKPVILDFYADWCTSCKVMEATTFKDPRVQKALREFTVIKIDITANNAADQALLNYFHVIAPPTFLFFDTEGKELDKFKLVGEVSATKFLKTLGSVYNSPA